MYHGCISLIFQLVDLTEQDAHLHKNLPYQWNQTFLLEYLLYLQYNFFYQKDIFYLKKHNQTNQLYFLQVEIV